MFHTLKVRKVIKKTSAFNFSSFLEHFHGPGPDCKSSKILTLLQTNERPTQMG